MSTSKYLDLFINESREHLSAIEGELARLAAAPQDRETLQELFRHAHSIKGMAATMGYGSVAEAAHGLEDTLDRVRRGDLAFDEDLRSTVARGFDAIDAMISRIAGAAAPQGGETAASSLVRLQIGIAASSPVPAARALVAIKRLEMQGRIVRCAPPAEKIAQRDFRGQLDVLLDTARTAEALAADLRRLTDVATVDATVVRARQSAACPAEGTEAAEPPAPSQPREGEPLGSSSVRVPARSLDRFLDTIGELIVERSRLASRLVPPGDRAALRELDRLKSLVDRLYGDVMALRMLPFDTIASRFTRSVREVSDRLEKRVALRIVGREVLLDRSILEELIDPINHILRNAVDHGLETPSERRAAGKPERGEITIALERAGDSVTLRIEDDGRGVDPDRIRAAALRKGFLTEDQAAAIGPDETLMLTTIPGFSTADHVTDLSGRGVGMDVVRTRVETLGGRLRLRSRQGEGLSVEMRVPLTIVVVNAFLVESGGRRWAVPLASVRRTIAVTAETLVRRDGRDYARADGEEMPLYDLAATLGLPSPPRDGAANGAREALVASERDESVALAVDRILSRREIVVKPLRPPLEELRGFTGATILEDGTVALIVDPLTIALN